MASVARITDIRGLVSLNDGEEILKEKDPISENGGILTISDFARIIFDDGREIEVQGPAQITLNENFFQTGEFDIQDVQIGNLDLAQNVIQNLATNLEGAGLLDNQAEGFVRTEQLDPDNINFGNNDIDFVLEDEEQILNPVTDAPAAGETPAAQDTDAGTETPEETTENPEETTETSEETTETPEETTETPEETIPESTTDVISEQTIDEDTKDSVVEQTVDAVQEDTTDSIVNVPAQDEQTIDGIDEETTPESTNDVVTEQTTDEQTTDFVPESTVAETPETTTDEQTADVVSENTIDTVVTVPEQAEQTVDAVAEDTTDSIVNVSAQDEQTIAEIAEETTPESTNDVVTEQTTDEQTTDLVPETTTDLVPESTVAETPETTTAEDTKDVVTSEDTIDAVAENTTDSVVNVAAQDEQTTDSVEESTTDEQTTDSVEESTVPENVITEFKPEETTSVSVPPSILLTTTLVATASTAGEATTVFEVKSPEGNNIFSFNFDEKGTTLIVKNNLSSEELSYDMSNELQNSPTNEIGINISEFGMSIVVNGSEAVENIEYTVTGINHKISDILIHKPNLGTYKFLIKSNIVENAIKDNFENNSIFFFIKKTLPYYINFLQDIRNEVVHGSIASKDEANTLRNKILGVAEDSILTDILKYKKKILESRG